MPRIPKLAIIPLLIIILAISVTACAENGPPELTTDELQQILADSNTAMIEAGSYSFLMEMNMSANITSEEQNGKMSVEMSGDGAIDMETMDMQMIMDMSIAMDMGYMDMSMDDILMEMYMLDDWMYMHIAMEQMGDQWMKMPATPDLMDMTDVYGPGMIEQYMELWDSTIDLELLRTETLNNVECYVIRVVPDAQAVMDMLQNQSLPVGEMPIDEIDPEMIPIMEGLFDEMDYLVWIGKDDSYMYKMEMAMYIDFTDMISEISGGTGEEATTMLMNMSMTTSDFNEPVSITLPPEAANAEEISPEENPFL